MNEWISVTDKLPSSSKPVLITDCNEVIMGNYCHKCNIFESNYKEYTLTDVNYWMPLPKTPEVNL